MTIKSYLEKRVVSPKQSEVKTEGATKVKKEKGSKKAVKVTVSNVEGGENIKVEKVTKKKGPNGIKKEAGLNNNDSTKKSIEKPKKASVKKEKSQPKKKSPKKEKEAVLNEPIK